MRMQQTSQDPTAPSSMEKDRKNERSAVENVKRITYVSTNETLAVSALDSLSHQDGEASKVPDLVGASDSSNNSDGSAKDTLFSTTESNTSLVSLASDQASLTEGAHKESEIDVLCDSFHEHHSKKTPNHRITWGTVTTRIYPIIPGDHPDTYDGPPLTIDWDPLSETNHSIDSFERRRSPRRQEEDLRLGWITRRQMLRRVGFADDEILRAQQVAKKARQQREATISRLKFNRVEEIQQNLIRRIGRAFYPKKKKTSTPK